MFTFTMFYFHRKTRKDDIQEKQLGLVPSLALSKAICNPLHTKQKYI